MKLVEKISKGHSGGIGGRNWGGFDQNILYVFMYEHEILNLILHQEIICKKATHGTGKILIGKSCF